MLRIYAETNERTVDGCYCALFHDGRRLEEVAGELGIQDGTSAVIFYSDAAEEFEWDGVLRSRLNPGTETEWWVAEVRDETFRRLRSPT